MKKRGRRNPHRKKMTECIWRCSQNHVNRFDVRVCPLCGEESPIGVRPSCKVAGH